MANEWSFGLAEDSDETYKDGTVVSHRAQIVYLNGEAVGEVELHVHSRSGPDKVDDMSVGITVVSYGPLSSQSKPDTW